MDILYSDGEVAVIRKPVGADSEHEVPLMIVEALGGEAYPVHRLDLNVGGVMVYARTKGAAASLSRAVQEGSLGKEYVAQVHGDPGESGDWTDLLWRDKAKNKVYVVKRMRGGVRPARLTFTRLKAGDVSLVRIRLYTGRSHQIRVQFASRGFPLLGDGKYGARDALSAPRLYSCCISFPHGGKVMRFEDLPEWAQADRK